MPGSAALIVERNNPLGRTAQVGDDEADAGVLQATYNVFMSTPKTAGINSRAQSIYLRQPDGREMVDDNGDRIRDDEISGVVDAFNRWLNVESSI